MKQKTFAIIVALFTTLNILAIEPKAVLDKVAAKFTPSKSLTIAYELNATGEQAEGTILLQGNKFRNTIAGNTTIWFDGKTMWTYVKENDEVNITEPSQAQLAKINPYAFINLYKSGYDIAFGLNTDSYYEIILTAAAINTSSVKKAIVRVSKDTFEPLYVMMGGAKSNIEVSVKSYKTGKAYTDASYRFDKKKYPKAEVIDLR